MRTLVHKLLAAANATIAPSGLRIVTRSAPTRDFGAFVDHLRRLGMAPRTVVDVGVAFGTPNLYSSLPEAKFFLVEPVPSCRPLLERLEREIGATCFNVAAGATDGEMEFFVHDDVSGSSAYRQWEGEALDGTRVRVPMRRLDTIIPAEVVRPCLLKVDTQGAELEVLSGAERVLGQVDVAILEASFHQFRKGALGIDEVVSAMSRRGAGATRRSRATSAPWTARWRRWTSPSCARTLRCDRNGRSFAPSRCRPTLADLSRVPER